VKIYLISVFFLIFSGFQSRFYHIHHISYKLQIETRQLMTSQIRSHIEYVLQTFLVLISYTKLMKNLLSLTGFNTIS